MQDSTPKRQSGSIEELSQLVWQHLEARDWLSDDSRGVAISLNLEAAELLEHYQWSSTPVGGVEAVGEELADVFIYGIQLAQQNDIDIADAIRRKIEKSALKYPAENFKGKSKDAMRDAWLTSKLNHKKEGL